MQRTLTILALFAMPLAARPAAPQVDVPEAAAAVVATVDRFFAALSAGDIDTAAAELDPNLIVLEGGGAEHSAREYLAGHAKEDAEFLRGVRHSLVRRTARVAGGLAWVASESELLVERDGKPRTIASAETMILRPRGREWKIVHIHWSSRDASGRRKVENRLIPRESF